MTTVNWEQARRERQEKARAEKANGGAPETVEVGLTEDELATELTRRHRDELRYVAIWGAWLRWDSRRWEREPTLAVFDLARTVCREAGEPIGDAKLRAKILAASTRAAVENMARADRAHAAVSGQFDADLWHLNAPDGIVDLVTGGIRPHDPLAYHTKITAAAPDSQAGCPLWLRFLDRITDGDRELQSYLQRSAGYMLTGSTREHVLQFAYGTGANGKSVFTSTLIGILGDYAATAPMETFATTASERHPTELAMLRGARLVVAQETEQGRRWAESKIKALTGGDLITARFMRQDFFTYRPQFKLFIAGNHRPGLRGVDEAIRRRLHLVPFVVTIPPAERDPDLADKLKAEWPAILDWMIQGCLRWQERGLDPPEAVRAATDHYLEAEDAFALWREECTATNPNAWESSADLWSSWKAWAELAGEHVGAKKGFAQQLTERGLVPHREGGTGGRGYRGARLNRQDYTNDPRYGN